MDKYNGMGCDGGCACSGAGGDRNRTLTGVADVTAVLGGALSGISQGAASRSGGGGMFAAPAAAPEGKTILGLPATVVYVGGAVLGLGVLAAVMR